MLKRRFKVLFLKLHILSLLTVLSLTKKVFPVYDGSSKALVTVVLPSGSLDLEHSASSHRTLMFSLALEVQDFTQGFSFNLSVLLVERARSTPSKAI